MLKIVFDLKYPWKYKDESLIEKIKDFAENNNLKMVYLSPKVIQTICLRFSTKYTGSLYDYINQNIIKIRGVAYEN